MEEGEGCSWVRRAKFSHTMCPHHSLDDSCLQDPRLNAQPTTDATSCFASAHPDIPKAKMSSEAATSAALSNAAKNVPPESMQISAPTTSKKDHDCHHHHHHLQHLLRQLFLKASSSNRAKNKKEASWARCFFREGGKVTALETTEQWKVHLSKLFLGHKFASGAHSTLYQGTYEDKPVAVKIIKQPDDKDDLSKAMAARVEKEFNREVGHLSRLYHPNIIKLVGAYKDPPAFCIITEYLSEGSLRGFLRKMERKPLPMKKLVNIALGIARGMEYLHSNRVIHRDLKPENILFDQDMTVKIADLGIACDESSCDALSDDLGTFRWMAPEMIKHKSYGRKVDVYSFGLILWEMLTGTLPYQDMTPCQAAFAVVNKDLRPTIPTDCPPSIRNLIESCWAVQPERRPEFSVIVKVLEQLESALTNDGPLFPITDLTCQIQKKQLVFSIPKLTA